jgi:hypothetical protein
MAKVAGRFDALPKILCVEKLWMSCGVDVQNRRESRLKSPDN